MNAEDYLFWAQMLINGAKVGMIKKVLTVTAKVGIKMIIL